MAYLIDAGAIQEQAPLNLIYKGREFTGKARRNGIELSDGSISSPSAAAIRCYSEAGASRPSENGWQVWKSEDGRSLNALFAEAVGSLDDLFSDNEQAQADT